MDCAEQHRHSFVDSAQIIVKKTFIEIKDIPDFDSASGLRCRAASDPVIFRDTSEDAKPQLTASTVEQLSDPVDFMITGFDDTDEERLDNTPLLCYDCIDDASMFEMEEDLHVRSGGQTECVDIPDADPWRGESAPDVWQQRDDATDAPGAPPEDGEPRERQEGEATPSEELAGAPLGEGPPCGWHTEAAPGEELAGAWSEEDAPDGWQNEAPAPNEELEHLIMENQSLTQVNNALRENLRRVSQSLREQLSGEAARSNQYASMWLPPRYFVPMGVVVSPAQQYQCGPAPRKERQCKGAAQAKANPQAGLAPRKHHGTMPPPGQELSECTTVMLRNLPNNYTKQNLLDMLNSEGFARLYDFVYLPIDFRSRACMGYAFVNLVSSAVVPVLWAKFDGYRSWICPSKKVCSVSWSGPSQGLDSHMDRYRNSPVMHSTVPDECKPSIFADGVEVAFPPPTKTIRAPRMKYMNQLDSQAYWKTDSSGHDAAARGEAPPSKRPEPSTRGGIARRGRHEQPNVSFCRW